MTTTQPVPQPPANYGAVKGKNHPGLFYMLLPIWALLFIATIIAYHTPNLLNNFDAGSQTSVAGLALTVTVIGGFALFIYAHAVFTHADTIFRQDAEAGRDEYAAHEFRDWLNSRYDAEFTQDAAIDLVRGRTAHVNRANENGTKTRIKVYLDGIDPLANSVTYDYFNGIPDLTHLHDDLTLMIVEDPKPATARVYAWN